MLCDLQIFSCKVYHPEPPHAQSLFLFPIVFGIILIHFFDGKNNRTGQNLIICFGFSTTRRAARAIQESESELTKRANFLATESVNFSATMMRQEV